MIAPEVTGFLDYKRVECGLSPLSIETYGRVLSQFSAWFRKSPVDAKRNDLSNYLADCREAGLSAGTVNQCISALREFYKHLQRDGLIEHDPMQGIELLKREKRLPKALTEEEVRQLLDATDDPESALALRDRAMLELFYAAGVRVTELTTARLTGLDFRQCTLLVMGKGSKQRFAPLGGPAVRAIQAYLEVARPLLARKIASPYIFIGRWGSCITRQRVFQIVYEACDRANLPRTSPHKLRHSLATHMVDHRADLRTVQTILGHADISTTQIYLRVWPKLLHDELIRCHPRNNPARFQARLFEPSLVLLPGPTPCEECASPAMPGKHRCEKHVARAQIARKKHYQKKRAKGAL